MGGLDIFKYHSLQWMFHCDFGTNVPEVLFCHARSLNWGQIFKKTEAPNSCWLRQNDLGSCCLLFFVIFQLKIVGELFDCFSLASQTEANLTEHNQYHSISVISPSLQTGIVGTVHEGAYHWHVERWSPEENSRCWSSAIWKRGKANWGQSWLYFLHYVCRQMFIFKDRRHLKLTPRNGCLLQV